MEIAIVILNWNGKDHLEKFLPSVISNNQLNARIIVADNASDDDSVALLQSRFSQVEIIKNDFNGGFAQGYNTALRQVKADYYILLNSDVEVSTNWISPVIELMEKDKSIAACQPKIKSFINKNKFEHAGAAGGFIDVYGFSFCRGRIFDFEEEDTGQYNSSSEIFWASGACFFIRAELFHKAGGFDEDFFAHMEEIDLCWRLKNMGYKIMYCASSEVFHLGGGTLNYKSPFKTFLNFRNNLYLLLKNRPRKRLYYHLFIRLLIDGVAAAKFLFSGEMAHLKALTRAHFSFYKNFNKIKKKRAKNIRYPFPEIYRGSIVFDYFIREKKRFSELEWG